MAKIYVQSKDKIKPIKVKVKDEIKEELDIYTIDYITTILNKNFISNAYKNNCIDEDMTLDSRIIIEDEKRILKPVMYDYNLNKIAYSLYLKGNNIIDSSSPILKSDIDQLINMSNNDFAFKKITSYFKNSKIVDYLTNYKNSKKNYNDIVEFFTIYDNYRMLREYLRKNTYFLCLVLDKDIERYLILEQNDKSVIDEYTMTFNNSDEIRMKYKDKIDDYLEKYKKYLNSLSRVNNGYVVVLGYGDYNLERKKVLYKDTKSQINTFVENLDLVKKVAQNDYKNQNNMDYLIVFSLYQNRIIHFHNDGARDGYSQVIKQFKKELFEEKRYDEIRQIFHILNDKTKSKNKDTKSTNEDLEKVVEKEETIEKQEEPISDEDKYDKEEFLYEEEYQQMAGLDNDVLYTRGIHKIIK